ncbi:MAG: hypothetical protein JRI89_10065 [Deltaproteobacteria bacterium]|nr:hypothetical protein [Deltaproteobacteria bacterium]
MKADKLVFMVLAIVLMWCGLSGNTVQAKDTTMSKKIVVFYEEVSHEQVLAYAEEWQDAGVSVITELPFINGLVLAVPAEISSAELADDPRVLSVEDNQTVHIQAISATADGGAADGGAADGGAADGGAADGGAADGGAARSRGRWRCRWWCL